MKPNRKEYSKHDIEDAIEVIESYRDFAEQEWTELDEIWQIEPGAEDYRNREKLAFSMVLELLNERLENTKEHKQFKLGDIISGQSITGIEESYYTDKTGIEEYRSVHTEYFCRRIYADKYGEYVINPMNNFKERPGEGEDDDDDQIF